MKNIILFIIVGFFSACSGGQESQPEVIAPENTAVAETPELDIAAFDREAGKYVNNEVAVSGIVDHVCKHSGKKLLLVTDNGKVHVESDTRFDDGLVGEEINLKGIVRELRVDESYCLKMEEDNIKRHKEGETNEEAYQQRQKLIRSYRDSMATAGVDHLSFYSLEFVSLEKKNQ